MNEQTYNTNNNSFSKILNGEIKKGNANFEYSINNGVLNINIKENDRIAAYVPNSIESIIAFLASSKNGLVWSSCSPDFGSDGVIDRFSQIKPKVLITCDYYFYNGKKINILKKVPEILKKIKSIKEVIVFPYGNKFDSSIL